MVDCPFRRRVNLGDTPPRKEFPLHACAAPLANGNEISPLVYESNLLNNRYCRSGAVVTTMLSEV